HPDQVHGYEWESAAALALLRRVSPHAVTVFHAADPGVSHQVPAVLLAAAGLRVSGEQAPVDLLELGRRSENQAGPPSGPRI
ncbi:MAG TPA: hypothetical protein VFW26_11330, partial [Gaiellales bacterium]|nr:hypothetical protein [Gaiellales bacterium]